MRALLFFVIGLAVGMLGEAWRFNLVVTAPAPWIPIIIGYLLFSLFAFATYKKIRNEALFYVVFALLGIFLEIFVMGELPSIIASGLFGWFGWFSFWGSVALIPRLYITNRISRWYVLYFFCALTFFLWFQAETANPGSMGLFYQSLNIVYIYHFMCHRRQREQSYHGVSERY
ncbi:MAG: hypothetical protein JW869_03505 [Candidatus Omnitrophica bacterium]|nr:hypothetical protein [Candidatus Omnitrophota bacterium]